MSINNPQDKSEGLINSAHGIELSTLLTDGLETKIIYFKPNGIQADVDIRRLCKEQNMIVPFTEKTSVLDGRKVPSFGLSSMGYDIRLAPEWKVFDKGGDGIIDVLDFKEKEFVSEHFTDDIIIPPGSTVLSRTVETFKMPPDIMGICLGKSTLARLGIDLLVTPLEPGWSGHLVVEITNNTPVHIRLYAGIGVAQIVFFRSKNEPETSYKGGKYDNQVGVVGSKL